MARPNPLVWLPLFNRALEQEIGIAFRISGTPRTTFRNTLYECKKAAMDPRLDDIVMFLPGGDHTDEIWLCKKQVELDDASPK
jgi:hypothetical protein